MSECIEHEIYVLGSALLAFVLSLSASPRSTHPHPHSSSTITPRPLSPLTTARRIAKKGFDFSCCLSFFYFFSIYQLHLETWEAVAGITFPKFGTFFCCFSL
jgi:hypothetical protein